MPIEPDRERPFTAKVLHLVRPAAGGMRRHVALLTQDLQRRGVECAICGPEDIRLDGTSGVRYHALPITARTSVIADLRSIIGLNRLAGAYDLVHAHGVRSLWIAGWASRLRKIRWLATLHNVPAVHGPLQRGGIRMAQRKCGAFLAVSRAVADEVERLLHPSAPVLVIPNGVGIPSPVDRAAARRAAGIAPDALVVLGVGRLASEKGFDVLIEACRLARVTLPGLILRIVGGGDRERSLRRLAEAAGLDTGTMVGALDDVASWYAAADLVVVPSRTEGQGLVALEAMAHGLPVVASLVGGLPEVVLDGLTGLLVPSDRPTDLEAAMLRLLKDVELRRSMGAAGRARVQSDYAYDRMVDRIHEVYRTML